MTKDNAPPCCSRISISLRPTISPQQRDLGVGCRLTASGRPSVNQPPNRKYSVKVRRCLKPSKGAYAHLRTHGRRPCVSRNRRAPVVALLSTVPLLSGSAALAHSPTRPLARSFLLRALSLSLSLPRFRPMYGCLRDRVAAYLSRSHALTASRLQINVPHSLTFPVSSLYLD